MCEKFIFWCLCSAAKYFSGDWEHPSFFFFSFFFSLFKSVSICCKFYWCFCRLIVGIFFFLSFLLILVSDHIYIFLNCSYQFELGSHMILHGLINDSLYAAILSVNIISIRWSRKQKTWLCEIDLYSTEDDKSSGSIT